VTIRGPLAAVLLVALLVSVGVNLTIAGFAFGRFAGPRGGGGGPGEIDRLVMFGIRAFPDEIQKSIMDGAKTRDAEIRAKFDAVQAARRHMLETMRANPFDPAALDQAYADMRARTGELQQIGQQIMLDAVEHAPADVRAKIRTPPPRGPGPGGPGAPAPDGAPPPP
jgi:hypothetical protein